MVTQGQERAVFSLQGCLRRGSRAHEKPGPSSPLPSCSRPFPFRQGGPGHRKFGPTHPWPSYPSSILCLTKPPEVPPSQETRGGAGALGYSALPTRPWCRTEVYGMWAPTAPSSTYVLGTTPFFSGTLAFSFPNPPFPYTVSSYTECERHCSLHK